MYFKTAMSFELNLHTIRKVNNTTNLTRFPFSTKVDESKRKCFEPLTFPIQLFTFHPIIKPIKVLSETQMRYTLCPCLARLWLKHKIDSNISPHFMLYIFIIDAL